MTFRRGLLPGILTALGVAALLTGCSQVAALAPVGGDHLAAVRFAGLDVLVDAGTDILVAPVCKTEAENGVTCEGSTVDGQPIRVRSSAGDRDSLTVTVGTTTLYSGSLREVLDAAVRPAS